MADHSLHLGLWAAAERDTQPHLNRKVSESQGQAYENRPRPQNRWICCCSCCAEEHETPTLEQLTEDRAEGEEDSEVDLFLRGRQSPQKR